MSSLRRFQSDPKNLLNTALNMYRSKRIKTAIVEGVCDRRFLNQWIKHGAQVRFDGYDGKPLVEKAFLASRNSPYCDYEFLVFFADVDFDAIAQTKLHDHPSFVYHVFCFEQKKVLFNDLESYLINTKALEKSLANLDIDPCGGDDLRDRLEKASRIVGAYRAADILLRRKQNLRSSILNGLEVLPFFKAREIAIDVAALEKALPNWSNYKEHTDELIEIARNLDRESPSLWSLSRGHDVTEMLSLHLVDLGHRGMTKEKIELMLRLACEFGEFEQSPIAKRAYSGGINWFAHSSAPHA
jgi:hypothetical protein